MIPLRPSTSVLRPSTSPASSVARSASAEGVRSLAGRFCRSRARLAASATTVASATARSTSASPEAISRPRGASAACLARCGRRPCPWRGRSDSRSGRLPAPARRRSPARSRRGATSPAPGWRSLARERRRPRRQRGPARHRNAPCSQAHDQPAAALGVGKRERPECGAGLVGVQQLADLGRGEVGAPPPSNMPTAIVSASPTVGGVAVELTRIAGRDHIRARTPPARYRIRVTGLRRRLPSPQPNQASFRRSAQATTPGGPSFHAQDRVPRRGPHPDRKDGRRTLDAARPPSSAAWRSRPRWSAPRWSPSRSTTS